MRRCVETFKDILLVSAKTADKQLSMFHTLNRSGIVQSCHFSAPVRHGNEVTGEVCQ